MLTIPREQTGADTTWITDYDHAAEGRFQYRSVYLPDTLSVDTFYTAYTQVKVYGQPSPYDRTGWVATASSLDVRGGSTDRTEDAAVDGSNSSTGVHEQQTTKND